MHCNHYEKGYYIVMAMKYPFFISVIDSLENDQ